MPDVESIMLGRISDEIGEKLLPAGTDDTEPEVTVIVTEGLPLSDADEPLGELVPVVDKDPPLG